MPAVPDIPASAFSPSARALLLAVPNLRAMATARAVFRCGRRASVSLVWRTCFGGSDARCAAFAFRWREPLCGERFVNSLRLRQLVQASTLLDRRAHQLPDHISRRRLAPAWIEPGHSSRPFLARDVPDPRFPILRGLAGRLGSSLLPSGGAHGVAPFAGLFPVRVDAG